MATRSTASSDTDPQDPGDPADVVRTPEQRLAGAGEPAHDPDRRAFFRQFGKQAASAVGQVAGMADIVGRTSSALAGELLGLDEAEAEPQRPAFARSGFARDPVVSAARPAAEDAFRSAFRLTEEGLVILDQRRVPEALDEVIARRGSDVAYYLRLGVARGGPLMAQLAAYGLALTAAERADQTLEQRDAELRRTAGALSAARVSSRLLTWATERMRLRVTAAASGAEVADALRTEADAIAAEITAAEASMAATLVEALPQPQDRALTLLLHGSHGSLGAGQLGAGLAALGRWRDAGRGLRVFVTEGRPFMEGARLSAWELRQAGIDHRVIPDAAAAWLLDREPVDAVLIRAEWIAADGATGALVGARALAQLAASVQAERPLVVALGPQAATDPDTADGAAIPNELRPAHELTSYLADVPVRDSDALVPAADVVPAELIDLRVSERGAAWSRERP
jgi:methylthioribose-1-phosphate isomerase